MWCAFVSRRCHYLRYYAQIVETPKRLPNVELPKKRLTQDFKPLLTFDEHKQEKLKKVESQEQIESKKNDINLSNKLHELILHILPQDVTGMEARKVLHAHIKRHVTPLPDTIAKMIDRARPAKNKIKDQQDFVSKFTRHVKKDDNSLVLIAMLRYYQRGLYNVNVVNLFNASVKDVTTPGPYNFMIDFHTRREEFEQAREMYNLMLTNKIEPNDETNSLLTTMDVLTRTAPRPVEPKLTKLQEIQSKIEAHNNALTSLISSARYDDAIKLFKDMDLKDGHSYRIITESYARRHMFDLAEDMIKQTIQNEYEISNRTINSMAQEYASAGDVDNAMSIVETAPLIYQVIPSLEVVKRVRSAAYAKERRGEGERFYERMIKNHPIILRTENVNN